MLPAMVFCRDPNSLIDLDTEEVLCGLLYSNNVLSCVVLIDEALERLGLDLIGVFSLLLLCSGEGHSRTTIGRSGNDFVFSVASSSMNV